MAWLLQHAVIAAIVVDSCTGAAQGWAAYRHYGSTDVPYATYARAVSDPLAECNADDSCKAYNSKGELKRCAGCEGGSDCCVSGHAKTQPLVVHLHGARVVFFLWLFCILKCMRLMSYIE